MAPGERRDTGPLRGQCHWGGLRVPWGARCHGVPVPAAARLCGCRESAHVVRERSLIQPRSCQAAGEPRPQRAVWLVTLLVTRPVARRDHAGGGQRGILQPGPAPWWVGAWCGQGVRAPYGDTHGVTRRVWAPRGARCGSGQELAAPVSAPGGSSLLWRGMRTPFPGPRKRTLSTGCLIPAAGSGCGRASVGTEGWCPAGVLPVSCSSTWQQQEHPLTSLSPLG